MASKPTVSGDLKLIFPGDKNLANVWVYTWDTNYKLLHFTFMLPCNIIDLFLNNQPDALIIQIYSVIKLHVSGILSAHRQQFSTVYSALVSFMQVFWWPLPSRVRMEPSWLCLEAVIKKPAWNLPVPNVQYRTPDDGQKGCLKHVEFCNRINLDN